jgi:hypothetical protein
MHRIALAIAKGPDAGKAASRDRSADNQEVHSDRTLDIEMEMPRNGL